MSGMPGPWSTAMMTTPWRSPFWERLSVISPRLAYIRMLRAISEMAAAMTVCSPLEKPATAANARPCCRASTTSTSAAIDRRSSSPTAARLLGFGFEGAFFGPASQEGQTFLEVEHRRNAFERQTELDHREGNVGLDADDHRFGAAQPRHVRDVAQRTHRERVHDVERGDVDDDAATARAPDLSDQRFAEMGEIGVSEGRLDGRDEILPLPQNRYFHCVLRCRMGELSRRFWGDLANPFGRRRAVGEQARTLGIDDADDRQNEESLAHLQHRRRQLADRFLLLPDDALALFHESDGHRVRDAVCRGLVAVQDPVQFFDVVLVFGEQGAGEHVTEEEHDTDDFVCFDSSGNDSLRQSP